MPYHAQYISNFTDNHRQVFSYSGFKDIRNYRYWDPATRGVDFRGLLEDIEEAPEDSVIVLHMAAHNPTGCDLTQEQWEQIADVVEVCLLYPSHGVAWQTHRAHHKQNTELKCTAQSSYIFRQCRSIKHEIIVRKE